MVSAWALVVLASFAALVLAYGAARLARSPKGPRR
jgi:hypothetical protein